MLNPQIGVAWEISNLETLLCRILEFTISVTHPMVNHSPYVTLENMVLMDMAATAKPIYHRLPWKED
jgi:hypothetical protein